MSNGATNIFMLWLLRREADGGGGAAGAEAFDGANIFPVGLQTGPKGWKLLT